MSSCACVHVCPTAVYEMSNILNTGLDKQSLAILVNLCEAGVNPEALAAGMLGDHIDMVVPLKVGTSADLNCTLFHMYTVVKELRKDATTAEPTPSTAVSA